MLTSIGALTLPNTQELILEREEKHALPAIMRDVNWGKKDRRYAAVDHVTHEAFPFQDAPSVPVTFNT